MRKRQKYADLLSITRMCSACVRKNEAEEVSLKFPEKNIASAKLQAK